MRKKLLMKVSVMFLVLMLAAALTGCSKKDNDQEDKAVTQETTEDTAGEAVTPEPTATVAPTEAPTPTEAPVEAVVVEGGIKETFTLSNMQAGTCLSDAMIRDSKYTELIIENFNQITLENNMKPDYILNRDKSIASGELTVEFSKKTTDLLDWAKNNGMKVRGHVLVWYSQTPDWIFYDGFDKAKGLVDRDTMLARMESYIKQAFEQLETLGYTDTFYAYDIVNEAIMEDGSLRNCLWKQIIGDDYLWYAFSYADKYAPESIKLYYNDYNEQFKTDAVVKMAQSLVTEDGRSLIDGIGCQGHLYTGDNIDQYMSTLEAFSATGLDVQITELDVSLGTWQNILPGTEENLKVQGQYYYELMNRIMEENKAGKTNVSAITFWGFSDQLSWRRDRSPLLFNSSLEPKYSYYGVKQDKANAGY